MNDEKNIIGSFLQIKGYDFFEKKSNYPTLIVALRGARKVCGRDVQTGKIKLKGLGVYVDKDVFLEKRYYSNLLICVTNYLIILDLIGSIFSNMEKNVKSRDGIKHALLNFSNLKENEIKAIEGLRNSLAHNFSLANDSYRFELSTDFNSVIELPKNNGSVTRSNPKFANNNYIKVNEVKLCQLIEDIIQNIKNKFLKDKIRFKKGMNIESLLLKFTIK